MTEKTKKARQRKPVGEVCNTSIHFRLTDWEKDEFLAVCKDTAVSPALMLRMAMRNFVAANSEEEGQG